MTHTPGPWEAIISDRLIVISGGQDNDDLAEVFWTSEATVSTTREQAEANSRLIAAAPTLLAILKAAAEDDVVQWHDGSLLKAAREAIAKAEGRR